jgi:hypothetical protein
MTDGETRDTGEVLEDAPFTYDVRGRTAPTTSTIAGAKMASNTNDQLLTTDN